MRAIALILLLGLTGCPQPPACPAAPGHLCIQAVPSTTGFQYYRAEVRVGSDCSQLGVLDSPVTGPSRFQQMCPTPPGGLQCETSLAPTQAQTCPDGSQAATPGGFPVCPVPAHSGNSITANIDLTSSPGPGSVRMFLFDQNGACLEGDEEPFSTGRLQNMSVVLNLTAGGCANWHKPCMTQADCGGTQMAQVCCNSQCIPPPVPPGGTSAPGHRAMTFIPAGTMVMGDPNSELMGEWPCCKLQGQDCTMDPMPTITIAPLYIDVYEADVASYASFLNSGGASNADVPQQAFQRPASYPAAAAPKYCTFTGSPVAADAKAQQRAMNCVNLAQASDYCSYRPLLDEPDLAYPMANAGLPRESEWEWIAVGGHVLPLSAKPVVPWSTDPGASVPTSCQDAGINFGGSDGVSCAPAGPALPPVLVPGASMVDQTPGGVVWPSPPIWDLAGNLSEWTSTNLFDTNMPAQDSGGLDYCTTADESTGPYTIVRGSAWASVSLFLTTFRRATRDNGNGGVAIEDTGTQDQVGVRCVLRLPPN